MLYDWTNVQFAKVLNNLSAILDKASAYADSKKFDVNVLLESRLAPDQFNFIRQVQIACDTAKFCPARLTGKEAPAFEDSEKTVAELKTRIAKTITFLQSFHAEELQNKESVRITQPRWQGKSLSGAEYVSQHVVPNFYFHVTTAYAILRHNGVDVGKADYLGALPYRT